MILHKESLDLIHKTLQEIKKTPLFLFQKKRHLQSPQIKSFTTPSIKPLVATIPINTPQKKENSTISDLKKPLEDLPPQNQETPLLENEPVKETTKFVLNSQKVLTQPIKLEKIEPTTSQHSLSIKKHLLSLDPSLPLIDHVLDDIKARERQKRGVCLYATAILVFENNANNLLFLKNLEKVVSNKFLPAMLYNASVIEKENGWDSFLSSKSLKLIIATDHEIFHAKNLMKLYKELPNQSRRMVKDIDLFLLPDINLYFKQPILKRSLYKALCHKIKTL